MRFQLHAQSCSSWRSIPSNAASRHDFCRRKARFNFFDVAFTAVSPDAPHYISFSDDHTAATRRMPLQAVTRAFTPRPHVACNRR